MWSKKWPRGSHIAPFLSRSPLPTASNRARRFLDATSGHLLLKEARRSIPLPGCYPCSSESSCLAPKPAAYVPQGCPLPAGVLGEVLKRKAGGCQQPAGHGCCVFCLWEETRGRGTGCVARRDAGRRGCSSGAPGLVTEVMAVPRLWPAPHHQGWWPGFGGVCDRDRVWQGPTWGSVEPNFGTTEALSVL